jgi:hypothetical protein
MNSAAPLVRIVLDCCAARLGQRGMARLEIVLPSCVGGGKGQITPRHCSAV